MTTGSSDFEPEANQPVATNIGKIGTANVRRGNGFVWRPRPWRFCEQRINQSAQICGTSDCCSGDKRCFGIGSRGNDDFGLRTRGDK
jgi:hypothetical protein